MFEKLKNCFSWNMPTGFCNYVWIKFSMGFKRVAFLETFFFFTDTILFSCTTNESPFKMIFIGVIFAAGLKKTCLKCSATTKKKHAMAHSSGEFVKIPLFRLKLYCVPQFQCCFWEILTIFRPARKEQKFTIKIMRVCYFNEQHLPANSCWTEMAWVSTNASNSKLIDWKQEIIFLEVRSKIIIPWIHRFPKSHRRSKIWILDFLNPRMWWYSLQHMTRPC